MKSAKNDLTLENVGKLLDSKLVPVYGELNSIHQQIDGLTIKVDSNGSKIDTLGSRVNSLDAKFESFRQETGDNFNTVFDGLTSLGEAIDKNLEPRLKRLENAVFAQ